MMTRMGSTVPNHTSFNMLYGIDLNEMSNDS